MASDAHPNDRTITKDQETGPPIPVLAPAVATPAPPSAAGSTLKASTLIKMGFAPITPVTDGGDGGAAAGTVAPPASPVTTTLVANEKNDGAAQQQQQQQHDRTKMLMQHKSSSLGFLQAAKQRRKPWYRPSLVRLIRFAQCILVLRWTIPVLQSYKSGSICPKPVLCATGFVEIALLCLSKISGLLMYPLLALVFLSKCSTVRTFFQHTYVAEMMDLYGLHELHVQFGYELAVLTALHAAGHLVRYALHDPRLFAAPSAAMGRNVTLSGYLAAVLMALVTASLGWGWLKRHASFEPRKAVHMLAAPMLVALCFHHPRLLATAAFLLVAYGLDWAYNNLFKTYRVDDPRLFPIGNHGTLVEFRLPPGFQCRSGQYLFVCVPHLSKYEWHAFSSIPITFVDGSLGCSFYAQACGDWTSSLLATARRNVRRPLWVNGAYPAPFDTSVKFDYLFIVCTGIGITPGISVVSQYGRSKEIVLIWVCRSQELIDLYRSEIQVVQSKVFYTGGRRGEQGGGGDSRVEGSVVYASGRPDLCGEIKNVILHRRPLDPRLAEAQRESGMALPSFATSLAAAASGGGADTGKQQGSCGGASTPKTPRGSLRRTMVPSPTPEHALESGSLVTVPPSPRDDGRRSLTASGVASPQQPHRQALTHLYEVDREEEVDPSEWLVLYCGASTALGDTLKDYCGARGIKYKTEFFGSW